MSNAHDCEKSLVRQKGNYPYLESGLPNVFLKNIEWYKCEKCGETEAVIPRVGQLHRCLAWRIICKPGQLIGPEIRFLRKMLRLSQRDFASHLDVNQVELSRWETDNRTRRNKPTDQLIRVLYLLLKKDEYTEKPHLELHRFLDRLAMFRKAAHRPSRKTIVIDPGHCSEQQEVTALLEG